MKYLSQRSLIYITVFGSLWGFAEATLGSVLHILNIPLSGLFLSLIGFVIAMIARSFNNVRGSTILMALIAASIKMLSFSSVKIGPFAGILMEGVIIESVIFIFNINYLSFIIAALLVSIYPILQSIFTKSVLFGANFIPVILDLAEGFSKKIGYQAGWWLLALYISIHIISGLIAAYIAYKIKNTLTLKIKISNNESNSEI